MAVGRPALGKRKRRPLTVRCRPDMRAMLDNHCLRTSTSYSTTIDLALEAYFFSPERAYETDAFEETAPDTGEPE